MRVLGIDPGAERCGFAVLHRNEQGQILMEDSGLVSFPKYANETFQIYKCRLIEFWAQEADTLIGLYAPDEIAIEIVPAVGGGNFVAATQSYLAHTQATTLHAIAALNRYPVHQIGATTVKARIGGRKSSSKVQVRNGVFEILPEVEVKKKSEWKTQFREGIYDESDAFAIALTHLGMRRSDGGN